MHALSKTMESKAGTAVAEAKAPTVEKEAAKD
jgi:hypothetical protein